MNPFQLRDVWMWPSPDGPCLPGEGPGWPCGIHYRLGIVPAFAEAWLIASWKKAYPNAAFQSSNFAGL